MKKTFAYLNRNKNIENHYLSFLKEKIKNVSLYFSFC